MSQKNIVQKGFVAVAAPLTLALGIGAVSVQASPGYVTNGGGVWMNNYKECWNAAGGVDKKLEECGDVIEKAVAAAPAPVDGDADGDGVKDSKDKCPNTRAGAKVNADGCEIISNVTIDLVEGEFDFDSAKLKPGMMAALDEVAAKVKATPGEEMLNIVGHTDSTGPDAYNMTLSVRRAQAAADYLADQGVSRASMTIEGKGETSPVADNGTREGRAQNRRVEINSK
jgi:OOP family OmpA-OmpF porin